MRSVRHARRRHHLLTAACLALFGLSASARLVPALAGSGCGAHDLAYGNASCAVPYVDTIAQGTTAPAVSVFSTSIDRTLQTWGAIDAVAAANSTASFGTGNVPLERTGEGGTENSGSRPATTGSTGISLSSLATAIRETFIRLLGKDSRNSTKPSGAPARQLDPDAAMTSNGSDRNSIDTEVRPGAGTVMTPVVSTSGVVVSSVVEPADTRSSASSEIMSADVVTPGAANPDFGSSPIDFGTAEPGLPASAGRANLVNSNAIDFDVLGSGAERDRHHSRQPKRRAAKKAVGAPKSKPADKTVDLQLSD